MQIRLLKELMPHHSHQKRQVSGLKETQEDNIGGKQPCLVVALCVCQKLPTYPQTKVDIFLPGKALGVAAC